MTILASAVSTILIKMIIEFTFDILYTWIIADSCKTCKNVMANNKQKESGECSKSNNLNEI